MRKIVVIQNNYHQHIRIITLQYSLLFSSRKCNYHDDSPLFRPIFVWSSSLAPGGEGENERSHQREKVAARAA